MGRDSRPRNVARGPVPREPFFYKPRNVARGPVPRENFFTKQLTFPTKFGIIPKNVSQAAF